MQKNIPLKNKGKCNMNKCKCNTHEQGNTDVPYSCSSYTRIWGSENACIHDSLMQWLQYTFDDGT